MAAINKIWLDLTLRRTIIHPKHINNKFKCMCPSLQTDMILKRKSASLVSFRDRSQAIYATRLYTLYRQHKICDLYTKFGVVTYILLIITFILLLNLSWKINNDIYQKISTALFTPCSGVNFSLNTFSYIYPRK